MLFRSLLVASISGISISACAAGQPPRVIDFSAPVSGLDGKPYEQCVQITEDGKKCAKSEVMTLGMISAAALSVPDRNGTLLDQIERGKLASLLIGGPKQALSSREITMVKDQIGKFGLPAVIVYRSVEAIDPASVSTQVAPQ